MIGADRDLVLGQDHPGGFDAAQLCLAELRAVRHHRAGPRDRNGLSRPDVRRAADDLRRLAVADVDHAHGQPVGVRMLVGAQDLADDEAVERADAVLVDALDLGPCERQPLGELAQPEVRAHVVVEPFQRDSHPNCSRSRTSLSKNIRRSGTPCLSIAMRSTPMPNAKPCTFSGS